MQLTESELRVLRGKIVAQLVARGWRPPAKLGELGALRLVDDMTHTHASSTLELTHRELEVLELYCHGRRDTWISESLGISRETVRDTRRRVLRKLGAATIAHAAALAVDQGIVQMDNEEEASC